jgi:hypothetical protein
VICGFESHQVQRTNRGIPKAEEASKNRAERNGRRGGKQRGQKNGKGGIGIRELGSREQIERENNEED